MLRIQRLAMFLEAHFSDIELYMPEIPEGNAEEEKDNQDVPGIVVRLDDADAFIDLSTMVGLDLLSPMSFSDSNWNCCRMLTVQTKH